MEEKDYTPSLSKCYILDSLGSFKLADAIEERVAAASLRTEKMTRAILTKALRGELVPTDAELARREGRTYESASDLSARIKSERGSKEELRKIRGN